MSNLINGGICYDTTKIIKQLVSIISFFFR